MGIGVNGSFRGINNFGMNKLATEGPNIEKNGQTVKESAAFPEEKPDVDKTHYNSKDEATNANIRRLINSLNDDVRIIIIKLIDGMK